MINRSAYASGYVAAHKASGLYNKTTKPLVGADLRSALAELKGYFFFFVKFTDWPLPISLSISIVVSPMFLLLAIYEDSAIP